jgi:putative cell wall-binding protein
LWKKVIILLTLSFIVSQVVQSNSSHAETVKEEYVHNMENICTSYGCGAEILMSSDDTLYARAHYVPLIQAITPDGTMKWEVNAGDDMVGYQVKSAVGEDGTLYIPYKQDDTYGIVAISKNGQTKWESSIQVESLPIEPHLNKEEGKIYVSDADSDTLYALNEDDGSVAWELEISKPFAVKAISQADGMVYVSFLESFHSSTLYAIEGATGEVKWTKDNLRLSGAVNSFDVSSLGTISYLEEREGDHRALVTLNRDGSEKWRTELYDPESMYHTIRISPSNEIFVLGYVDTSFTQQGKQQPIHFNGDSQNGEVFFGNKAYYFFDNTVPTNMTTVDPTNWEEVNRYQLPENLVDITWGHSGKLYATSSDAKILSINVEDSEQEAASVERLHGKSRYKTAVEISKETWTSADTVIIARGDNYPDALVGTPLAIKQQAPILLTKTGSLNANTKEEIKRLGAKNAIILGGTGAVSDAVESELEDMTLEVKRIAGANRFETASFIAEEVGPSKTAVVAYGYNFPDALAVASYAAQNGYPILLTRTDSIPDGTMTALDGVENTYVVGGTGVVSNSVFETLPNAVRLAGKNRYETAYNVIKEFQAPTSDALVATGRNFPDALSGSVLAAKSNVPLLLVEKESLPLSMEELKNELGLRTFTTIGGEGAIGNQVIQQLLD